MTEFFDALHTFLASNSLWVYVFIFFGRIGDVSMGTLRIVLINRGERFKGSLVAFIEVVLWLVVASSVLVGWTSDIWKAVAYCLAYACGNYVGSWLDELLAFGMSSLQIVVPTLAEVKQLASNLQGRGYGVTSIDVHGKGATQHYMLIMIIKRKLLREAMDEITHLCPTAMVTVSDVKTVRGGYMRSSGKRRGSMMK